MEEPESNIKYKESNPGRLNRQKSESIKIIQKAWERRTNKYICPNHVTVLWFPIQKKPNAEVNESNILALKELSRL